MNTPSPAAQGPPPADDALPLRSYTPGLVAVTAPSGEVVQVAKSDAQDALANGYTPASEAQYFGQKHGGAGEVAAGLVGAARGATFGVFDPAIVGAIGAVGGQEKADEYRNTLRLLKETNPGVSLGGEIAGAVLPAAFGDTAGLATAADEGASFFGRAAARGLEAAPRAFGEGTAIGLGNQLSEDTLANRKLVPEAYLSAGVKGGALGVLMGAGGAAGLGAVGDKLGTYFGRGAEAAEGLGTRIAGAEEKAAVRGGEEAGEQSGGRLGSWIQNKADELSFKGATGAKTADLRKLGIDVEAIEGREQELGRVLREQELTGPTVSQAETGRRLSQKVDEIGKSFTPMYKALDAAETSVKPSLNNILTAFDEKVRAPRLAQIDGSSELRGANDFLKKMTEQLDEHPSFEKLWNVRRELDGKLTGEYAKVAGAPSPVGAADMRALKDIVNQEISDAAAKADPAIATQLREANSLYSDLKTVHGINTKNVARDAMSNNAISLTDTIAATHGGPLGLVYAAGNMVKRRYGDQLAAHVLDKAANLEMFQRATTKLDDTLSSGTGKFINGEKSAMRPIKPVTSEEVRALREATRTPDIVNARTAEHLGDIVRTAPQVAQGISTTVARAAAWAQYALPKEQAPVGPVFSQPKPRPLSDSQLVKARSTMETIADGSIVVDRLVQGRLTPEHVAALKYVHPETYAQIQTYLTDHATEIKPKLTVQQQFQLGMLFGTPITEASLPENIRAFQASFSQGNQAPGPGGAGGVAPPKMSGGPVNIGTSRAMGYDRLEAGSK